MDNIKFALANKYEIINLIGSGGNASVYRAIDKENRPVALKVIHSHLVHDKEDLERFKREANLTKSLEHKNIVKVYDVGNENDIHYMSLEFLEGIDLFKLIKAKRILPLDEALNYIIPIAAALDYAHNKNIIHRDIKSANIIITNKRRPVLTDFGIAHTSSGTRLTQTGAILGTVEYMSPEQAEGGNVDGRSDLYSLGIVLYECITGTVPFRSDNNNPVITLHKIIHDPLTSPKSINNNIPAWLDSILCKVLEKNRNYRFNSGAELVSALKNRQEVKISPPTVKYNRTTVPKQKLSSQKPPSSKELLRPHWFTATIASKAIIYTIGMLAIILLIIIIWNNINSQNNTFSTKTPPITEKIIQPEVQKMAINQTLQTEEKQSPKPAITKQANEPEKPNKEKPKTEKQQKPEETVEKTSVPSVIGRQFSVAQAVINANGFNVGSINYVDDPSRKGIVLKQIPPSGVEIKPGSSINLIIGK